MSSILTDTKKVLGLAEDDASFDVDVIMHINSILGVLTQLGIGPDAGFVITDDTATWDNFLGDDPRLAMTQTYLFLRVKLLFDPPATSFHLEAARQQYQEFEWRLNVHREEESWTDPTL